MKSLWAPIGDGAAAQRAMRLGAIGVFGGSALSIFNTVTDPFGPLRVMDYVSLGAAVACVVSALLMWRGTGSAVATSLALWIALGLLPGRIPVWVGFVVLAGLIVAIRGSRVLTKLRAATGATLPNPSLERP